MNSSKRRKAKRVDIVFDLMKNCKVRNSGNKLNYNLLPFIMKSKNIILKVKELILIIFPSTPNSHAPSRNFESILLNSNKIKVWIPKAGLVKTKIIHYLDT